MSLFLWIQLLIHGLYLMQVLPCQNAHYGDIIMGAIASQITSLTIVYSIVYSDADQRKHQSSASLAFVQGIHRGPVNSPHKWPVTRKMFAFDDVIMRGVTLTWASFILCHRIDNGARRTLHHFRRFFTINHVFQGLLLFLTMIWYNYIYDTCRNLAPPNAIMHIFTKRLH